GRARRLGLLLADELHAHELVAPAVPGQDVGRRRGMAGRARRSYGRVTRGVDRLLTGDSPQCGAGDCPQNDDDHESGQSHQWTRWFSQTSTQLVDGGDPGTSMNVPTTMSTSPS